MLNEKAKNARCFVTGVIFSLKRAKVAIAKKSREISWRLSIGISLPNVGNAIKKKAEIKAIGAIEYFFTIKNTTTGIYEKISWNITLKT